ncbi:MAG: flagellin [Arcobacteraceae bacterium]|nr:flagellin [Arcobacteraceae bacterium]
MRINTNVASLTAQESAVNVGKNLSSSLEKLSTGLRINKASDDASGMAIADKLRTQASSVGQGIANANSANTFIQIADKAMGEQSNILDIVKTKLMQASTSTTSSDGRTAILNDIKALLTQFDAISSSTNYNGTTLLQGADFDFQIGEDSTNDKITVETSYSATTAGVASTTGGTNLVGLKSLKSTGVTAGTFTASLALGTMATVDKALSNLNTVRSEFGSGQNQIESALRNMMTTRTNLKAAESIIRDVDYAAESANFNKQNIIAQAGTYAISQANAIQQNVLRLLQ